MTKVLAPSNGHTRPTALLSGDEALVSYSVPCPTTDPLDFLQEFSGVPRVYLESQTTASIFAGAGSVAVLTAGGPGRFDAIRQQARQLFAGMITSGDESPAAMVGPRLFGGFAFEPDFEPDGTWEGFGSSTFILPQFQLVQINGNSWLTLNRLLGPGENPDEALQEMRREIEAAQRQLAGPPDHANRVNARNGITVEHGMSRPHWNRIVSDATARVHAGVLEKVVLAQAQAIKASRAIDPLAIVSHLKAAYPSCYAFLIEPVPGHAFFGATPELLVEISASQLNAMALAGSIRRGASEAEDDALGREMMMNPKERHEHALVVDAIEEGLRGLTVELDIESQPGLSKLKNVQHLKTEVRGVLRDGYDILSVVEALHPTPAVGGLPRKVALRLIAEAEPIRRGWYASPVGWIDHEENGLFVVGIRSAVSAGREARVYAGAGIVADSVPEAEWQETQLKFQPLLHALQGTPTREHGQP